MTDRKHLRLQPACPSSLAIPFEHAALWLNKDVCAICSSDGDSDLMVTCYECAESYHYFCLTPLPSYCTSSWAEYREISLKRQRQWRCPKCLICELCRGKVISDGKSAIICHFCNAAYHVECVDKIVWGIQDGDKSSPTSLLLEQLKNLEDIKIWACPRCAECDLCTGRNPEPRLQALVPNDSVECSETSDEIDRDRKKIWSRGWHFDGAYMTCDKCHTADKPSGNCAVCMSPYRERDEGLPMTNCDTCGSWVHASCDGFQHDVYDPITELDGTPYFCHLCAKNPLHPLEPSAKDIKSETYLALKELITERVIRRHRVSAVSYVHPAIAPLGPQQDPEEYFKGINLVSESEQFGLNTLVIKQAAEGKYHISAYSRERFLCLISRAFAAAMVSRDQLFSSIDVRKSVSKLFRNIAGIPEGQAHLNAYSCLFSESLVQLARVLDLLKVYDVRPMNTESKSFTEMRQHTECNDYYDAYYDTVQRGRMMSMAQEQLATTKLVKQLTDSVNAVDSTSKINYLRKCAICKVPGHSLVCGRLIPACGVWVHVNCVAWCDKVGLWLPWKHFNRSEAKPTHTLWNVLEEPAPSGNAFVFARSRAIFTPYTSSYYADCSTSWAPGHSSVSSSPGGIPSSPLVCYMTGVPELIERLSGNGDACRYCNKPHALNRCAFKGCTKSYHFSCAVEDGVRFFGSRKFMCRDHHISKDIRQDVVPNPVIFLSRMPIVVVNIHIPELKSWCNRLYDGEPASEIVQAERLTDSFFPLKATKMLTAFPFPASSLFASPHLSIMSSSTKAANKNKLKNCKSLQSSVNSVVAWGEVEPKTIQTGATTYPFPMHPNSLMNTTAVIGLMNPLYGGKPSADDKAIPFPSAHIYEISSSMLDSLSCVGSDVSVGYVLRFGGFTLIRVGSFNNIHSLVFPKIVCSTGADVALGPGYVGSRRFWSLSDPTRLTTYFIQARLVPPRFRMTLRSLTGAVVIATGPVPVTMPSFISDSERSARILKRWNDLLNSAQVDDHYSIDIDVNSQSQSTPLHRYVSDDPSVWCTMSKSTVYVTSPSCFQAEYDRHADLDQYSTSPTLFSQMYTVTCVDMPGVEIHSVSLSGVWSLITNRLRDVRDVVHNYVTEMSNKVHCDGHCDGTCDFENGANGEIKTDGVHCPPSQTDGVAPSQPSGVLASQDDIVMESQDALKGDQTEREVEVEREVALSEKECDVSRDSSIHNTERDKSYANLYDKSSTMPSTQPYFDGSLKKMAQTSDMPDAFYKHFAPPARPYGGPLHVLTWHDQSLFNHVQALKGDYFMYGVGENVQKLYIEPRTVKRFDVVNCACQSVSSLLDECYPSKILDPCLFDPDHYVHNESVSGDVYAFFGVSLPEVRFMCEGSMGFEDYFSTYGAQLRCRTHYSLNGLNKDEAIKPLIDLVDQIREDAKRTVVAAVEREKLQFDVSVNDDACARTRIYKYMVNRIKPPANVPSFTSRTGWVVQEGSGWLVPDKTGSRQEPYRQRNRERPKPEHDYLDITRTYIDFSVVGRYSTPVYRLTEDEMHSGRAIEMKVVTNVMEIDDEIVPQVPKINTTVTLIADQPESLKIKLRLPLKRENFDELVKELDGDNVRTTRRGSRRFDPNAGEPVKKPRTETPITITPAPTAPTPGPAPVAPPAKSAHSEIVTEGAIVKAGLGPVPSSASGINLIAGTTLASSTATQYRALKKNRDNIARTRVGYSDIHSFGVFSNSYFLRGEFIMEYKGEIIRQVVSDKREQWYETHGKDSCYMFKIDANDTVCDATVDGGRARFINHSCGPNCESRIVDVDGIPRIILVAIRDIAPEEELTYDYHFSDHNSGERAVCRCGSKNCRKFI